MNEHFYNGFIKRAQDYGLSAIEADNLAKVAGEPGAFTRFMRGALGMGGEPLPNKPKPVQQPSTQSLDSERLKAYGLTRPPASKELTSARTPDTNSKLQVQR
jgi:hypothetical protein